MVSSINWPMQEIRGLDEFLRTFYSYMHSCNSQNTKVGNKEEK